MMRVLGGVIGITGCGILLKARTNLHFLRIAERLTAANTELISLLRGMAARYAQAWAIRSAARPRRSKICGRWLIARRKSKLSPMPIWSSRCALSLA